MVIEQCSLVANLTVFKMAEFDAVSSMDWTSKNMAFIGYRKKKVYFKLGKHKLAFQEQGRDTGFTLVRYHKIQRYIKRVYEAYMDTLVSSEQREAELTTIPQVRDFTDVFFN